MELQEQYGMADLRQYVNGRPLFPTMPPPGDLFSSGHRNLTQPQHHYEMVMVGHHQVSAGMVPCGHHLEFRSGCTTAAAVSVTGASTTSVVSGMEMEGGDGCGGGGLGGGDGGSGRWPRQETLTLLEIRSRLDSKFKEANQKGPLWDEVSRIMSEEHGYQRSGKKCREKFENLYKYYKKTKEGKAGRQDGKHYRFFRQLEALYGDNTSHPNSSSVSETHLMGNNFQFHNTNNNNINHVGQPNLGPFQAPKLCDSLTLSNSSEMGTSSSDDEIDTNDALLTENYSDEKKKKKKKRRRGWKAKIRDFIDSQMRKIMEKQEEWLERMMKILESKEQERISRDEEWRNQEAARIERDRKFWANERAWMEARDSALMEALKKLIRGKEARYSSPENENESESITNASDGWSECEITKLMELRSSSADSSRFQESGCSEEAFWEEIAAKMSCLGYNRSALVCKEKWDRISNYLRKTKEWNNKKGREDLKSGSHFHHHSNESAYNQGGEAYYWDINEQGAEPEISTRVAPNDSCFRLLVGADDGGGNVNLWENYGVKLSKE